MGGEAKGRGVGREGKGGEAWALPRTQPPPWASQNLGLALGAKTRGVLRAGAWGTGADCAMHQWFGFFC